MKYLHTLDPDELRESEDERIRKELICMINECTNWAHKKEYVKYLEKQKENPKSADSIPSDCVSNAKCEDRWHKVTDSLPDNGRLVLAKDCLGNVLLARYDGENWEVNVYDNEDHYCHNSISKWCEIPSEKQKEQKSTWSEEDEKIIDTIVSVLGQYIDYKAVSGTGSGYATPRYTKEIDWLKSISPQPKQEWSEEDEKMLEGTLMWLDDLEKQGEYVEKERLWLKSLRPVSKESLQPQMKYLHTLDPDELREMEDEYWKDVAELEAEDAAMERYYEEKYNR